MLSLSVCVIAWQHVVGHTYTTAQSMHLAPIVLLTSISTCTGGVLFFIFMSILAMLRWASVYHKVSQVDDVEMSAATSTLDPDIDSKEFDRDGEEQVKRIMNRVATPNGGQPTGLEGKVLRGDLMTISMVWTNVYGLGLSSFFLSYVSTMASSLATFSFVVGMSAVSIAEAVRERTSGAQSSWLHGTPQGKCRSFLHTLVLVMSIGSMCTVGAHVSSIHVNQIGTLRAEDVFLGIVGPCLSPMLLRCVKRPQITTLSTIETSLPFTMFICVTFMTTALAMGMKPYESEEEIGR